MLWPRARRLAVINQGELASTLTYLEELERSADAADAADADNAPLALATLMVASWPDRTSASTNTSSSSSGEHAARLLACLCRLGARGLLDTFIATVPATGRYDGAENAALAQALLLLPAPRAGKLITAVIAANARHVAGACAELLALCAERDDAATVLAPAARTLVDVLTGVLVTPPDAANPWRHVAPPDAFLVVQVLAALQRLGDASLADVALDHMLAMYAPDEVLVEAALALELTSSSSARIFAPAGRLHAWALAYLRARIAEPLAPPQDYQRPSTVACQCDYCAQLARFLADPARAS